MYQLRFTCGRCNFRNIKISSGTSLWCRGASSTLNREARKEYRCDILNGTYKISNRTVDSHFLIRIGCSQMTESRRFGIGRLTERRQLKPCCKYSFEKNHLLRLAIVACRERIKIDPGGKVRSVKIRCVFARR